MQGMELLHGIFERSAQRYPDNIAIEIPPTAEDPQRYKYTYAEVDRLASQLALRIAPLITGEQIVSILLPRRSHHLYVAQLAVLKAGAAYTCIEPTWPTERIHFILEDSSSAAVLTSPEHFDLLEGSAITNAECVVDVIDCMEQFESNITALHPPTVNPVEIKPNNLCYVIYTSGTTGKPKGVMIEHQSIVNLALSNISYFDMTPEDRVGQSASTSFDASVEEIYLAFTFGATLVMLNDDVVRMGPDLVPWLREERITVTSPTPTFLRMCMCDDPSTELPDLRLLYVGGEALPEDLVNNWAPNRWLENAYGPTECTVTVMRGRVYQDQPVTIGVPVAGNSAWVLDEDLNEVAEGEAGELCIGGAGVARGYLNRPKLTAEKFVEHPFFGRIYRTGDLVKKLPHGEYSFHGRIDTQVKIRGYRVELESIEAHLCALTDIQMAACKVQGAGTSQKLVAFVVSDREPDTDALQTKLEGILPSYMVPSHFAKLAELPFNSSGKLDRKALPEMEFSVVHSGEIVEPRNKIEVLIEQAFAAQFPDREIVSIHDDFFDLGGNSVLAAQVISLLRNHPETLDLTVRDLYQAHTVAKLAECVNESRMGQDTLVGPRLGKGYPKLVTLAQMAWIFNGVMFGSAMGYIGAFVVLPLLANFFGLVTFVFLLPLIGGGLILAFAPFSLLMAVFMKWLLIGRYKPGRHKVWGMMFLRHWLVQKVSGSIPWGLVQGTVFQNIFLRMLGAKVGKNVHIHKGVSFRGAWDLLEIGDNVTLGRDVNLRMIDYQNQEMVLGPIKIGNNCTLETRSGMSPYSRMEDNSYLTPLTLVPSHTTVPANEKWDGVPGAFVENTPPAKPSPQEPWSPIQHGLVQIAVGMFLGAVALSPGILMTVGFILYWNLSTAKVLGWLFSPVWGYLVGTILVSLALFSAVSGMFMMALEVRLLGRIKPGIYSRWRGTYIIVLMKQRIVEAAGNVISGTLYWPPWLRLAGMKIGRDCEISTIYDVVPELIEIGPETFFADGIYLGSPIIDRGIVDCSKTTFGRHNFLGNHSVIPAGTHLPDDVLIGVCTLVDDKQIKEGSSWFGHPMFELPHREIVEVDDSLTHHPHWTRYVVRLFWETLRFGFGVLPLLMMLLWFKSMLGFYNAQPWPVFFFGTMPIVSLAMIWSFAGLVWAAKWILLGKVKPGHHALWSTWVFKWDFLYMLWAAYARPVLTAFHETLAISWWMRAMGSKIGKHVLLVGGFSQVVDPDMLHFEDNATVACMFQAHTFEDRVLKLGHVHLREESTVGTNAVVLYGCDVRKQAHVSEQSVIMKHEELFEGRYYSGAPTQPAVQPDLG